MTLLKVKLLSVPLHITLIVMGYFRAILKSGEISERVLDLTVDVLRFNPGDYHAWALRRKIYDELKIPLKREIEFLNAIGTHLEKNFQIWHHRRCIMEIYAKDFDEERQFLEEIFYSDGKNYHAWSYRLWLVERFNLIDDAEFEFVDEELKDQVTNNSLWSYRYFLLNKVREFSKGLVEEEIKYTLNKLDLDKMNEAAWVYLRGWLASSEEEEKRSMGSNAKRTLISKFPWLKELLLKMLEESEVNKANRFIYMTLIDFAKAEGDKNTAIIYLKLLKNIDRLRENFYQWTINRLESH